jgi:rifampicin phosphotransferase
MSGVLTWLDTAAAPDGRKHVGGKGASLIAMTAAGFPVPPGFILDVGAHRAFLAANGLAGDLERSILEAYRELSARCGAGAGLSVAVRSSATVEDDVEASFAGAFDTFLNVQGEAALLDAVKRCWSSLQGPRVSALLQARNLAPESVGMAVVVQQMVLAEASGILFTRHPLTGNRNELVVNAAWGVGDAIVGGRVEPDDLVIDKATRRVIHRTPGEKQVMSVAAPHGTQDVAVDPLRQKAWVLSDAQLENLARMGCALEAHFGTPQDIEWALVEDRLYVLQSRPVALIDAEPAPPGDDIWPAVGEQPPQHFDLWTQVNVGEVWPDPVTPLVWSGVPFVVGTATRHTLRRLKTASVDGVQWAKRLYGRAYYNEGALVHILAEELGLPAALVDGAVGSRRGGGVTHATPFRPLRFLRRLPFFAHILVSQLRSGKKLEAIFTQVDARVAAFMSRKHDHLSDRELLEEVRAWTDHFIHAMNVNTELSISSMVAFGALQDFCVRQFSRDDLARDLVAGLAGIESAEMGHALWEMAQSLSDAGFDSMLREGEARETMAQLRDSPGAKPFFAMLEAFLQRHGHHCLNEGEWLHPRWAEAPEQLLMMIAGYQRASVRLDPSHSALDQAGRREEAIRWARTRCRFGRRQIFDLLLARTQKLVRLRENGKNCYVKAMYPVRSLYARIGLRWFERGWLALAEDMFFLTIPEVERIIEAGDPQAAGLTLPAIVAARREAFRYWSSVDAPEMVGADWKPTGAPLPTADLPGVALQGIPISRGVVRGTVRIVEAPEQVGLLRSGDILVTRATDPGWTPFFPLVAGLVVEVGGQLSHAAIIAREYGLPAIASVRNATRRLRNGQMISVDGTRGTIRVEDENNNRAP